MNHHNTADEARLLRQFWVLLLMTLVLAVIMSRQAPHLRTSVAEYGGVSFQLAFTYARAQAILRSWDDSARQMMAFQLGLDYLFLLVYPAFLNRACWVWVAAWPRGHFLRRCGGIFAYVVCVCVPFDALENYALWQQLQGAAAPAWPLWAGIFATIKFAALGLALLYLLPLLPKVLYHYWRRPDRPSGSAP